MRETGWPQTASTAKYEKPAVRGCFIFRVMDSNPRYYK